MKKPLQMICRYMGSNVLARNDWPSELSRYIDIMLEPILYVFVDLKVCYDVLPRSANPCVALHPPSTLLLAHQHCGNEPNVSMMKKSDLRQPWFDSFNV